MSKISLSLVMHLRFSTELHRYLKAKSDKLLLEKLRSKTSSFASDSKKGEPCFMDF